MINLYIVRHGLAEESRKGLPDTRRTLTRKGEQRTRKMAKWLKAHGCTPGVIISSPFLRAMQTAKIIRDILDKNLAIRKSRLLQPSADLEEFILELKSLKNISDIIITGHMPHLGLLASKLAGIRNPISLRKSGICLIDFPGRIIEGKGEIQFLIYPALLK